MKPPTPAQTALLGLKPSELAVIEEHPLLAPHVGTARDHGAADVNVETALPPSERRIIWIALGILLLCAGLALAWLLWVYVGA